MALLHQRGIPLKLQVTSRGQPDPSVLRLARGLADLSSFNLGLHAGALVCFSINLDAGRQNLYHIGCGGLDLRAVLRPLSMKCSRSHKKQAKAEGCGSIANLDHRVLLSIQKRLSGAVLNYYNMLQNCYNNI